MPFAATRIQLEINIQGEMSQKQKDKYYMLSLISSVQSLSRVQLFGTPWTAGCQASLSITDSMDMSLGKLWEFGDGQGGLV